MHNGMADQPLYYNNINNPLPLLTIYRHFNTYNNIILII